MRKPFRTFLWVAIAFLISMESRSQTPTDLDGNSLPPYAVARLGVIRKGLGARMWEHLGVRVLAFSPNGKWLATGGDNGVYLWDAQTGKTPFELEEAADKTEYPVRFSANSKILMAGPYHWDVTSGKFASKPIRSSTYSYRSGRWAASPDGSVEAFATTDNIVRVIDSSTNADLGNLELHEADVQVVAFSPDGKWIASGDKNGEVCLWEWKTGATRTRNLSSILSVHPAEVTQIIFSADSKLVALSSTTQKLLSGLGGPDARPQYDSAVLHILETRGLREVKKLEGANIGSPYSFSPDGKRLLLLGANTWIIRDIHSGKNLLELKTMGEGMAAAFSSNGKWAAVTFLILKHMGTSALYVINAADGTVRYKKDGTYHAVAFSSDNRILAAGGANGIQLFDVATGSEIGKTRPGGHQAEITHLAFSADGTRIVSGGADATVRSWDAKTGESAPPFYTENNPIKGVAISPDKKLIGGTNGLDLLVWDAATGETRYKQSKYYGSLDFSTDGKLLAAATLEKVAVMEASSGLLKQEIAHTEPIERVAFQNDGTLVATYAKGARLSNPLTGQELDRWELEDPAIRGFYQKVLQTQDKRWIAFGYHTGLCIQDLKLKRTIRCAGGNLMRGSPHATALSADLTVAAIADEKNLWILDLSKAQAYLLEGHSDGISALEFSPDGRTLVSGSTDTTALVWDVRTLLSNSSRGTGGIGSRQIERNLFRAADADVDSLSFSSNGRLLAWAGNTFGVWDVSEWKDIPQPPHSAKAVSLTADGRLLAIVGDYHGIQIWNAKEAKMVKEFPLGDDSLRTVAFSPDETTVIAGGNKIHMMNIKSGEEMFTLDAYNSSDVVFSPDGRWIASADEFRSMGIWDVITRKKLRSLPGGQEGGVSKIVWSPTGKLICWTQGNSIRMSDPSSGELLGILEGHQRPVEDLAFSKNGTRLASTSDDKVVFLWDMTTRQKIAQIQTRSNHSALAFHPQDSILAVADGGTIGLWSVP